MATDGANASIAAECRRLAALSTVPEVAQRLNAWAEEADAAVKAAATVKSSAENSAPGSVENAAANTAAAASSGPVLIKRAESSTKKAAKRVVKDIKSYAWDQTSSAIKIYITLAGVGEPGVEVLLNPDSASMEMIASNVNGKDHRLRLRLAGEILPKSCTQKVKSNRIILTLKKADSEKWEHLTEADRVAAEAKKPKFGKDDDNADPSASIMNMMKDMYQNGDDDMRRVIGKAWTESREKSAAGGL